MSRCVVIERGGFTHVHTAGVCIPFRVWSVAVVTAATRESHGFVGCVGVPLSFCEKVGTR